MAVHFTHADVPIWVPRDISLCLFRVLQEASHNVVKHSGVSRFDVELRGVADHAYLTIRDTGKGFDPAAAISARGLGLVSMRERLNLVGGTLSIKSGGTRGTEIFADVPLPRGAARIGRLSSRRQQRLRSQPFVIDRKQPRDSESECSSLAWAELQAWRLLQPRQ